MSLLTKTKKIQKNFITFPMIHVYVKGVWCIYNREHCTLKVIKWKDCKEWTVRSLKLKLGLHLWNKHKKMKKCKCKVDCVLISLLMLVSQMFTLVKQTKCKCMFTLGFFCACAYFTSVNQAHKEKKRSPCTCFRGFTWPSKRQIMKT